MKLEDQTVKSYRMPIVSKSASVGLEKYRDAVQYVPTALLRETNRYNRSLTMECSCSHEDPPGPDVPPWD